MKIIAYDLGTGGVKASLYDEQLNTLSKSFIEYPTFYPQPGYHEQRPADWWNGVVQSTQLLLQNSNTNADEIACVSLSGHSLVALPVGADGQLLLEQVPIWSDTRAASEAAEFFEQVPEESWYMTTGNGFPKPCYSVFKLMWLKKHNPEVFEKTAHVLGSKDYINFKLTGNAYTDYSYASGTGAYDLLGKCMKPEYLEAAGLPLHIFPKIVPSHHVVGKVTPQAAKEIGLSEHTAVVCGGVDNACMALGAVGAGVGRVYVSLGSSSWIPVNSAQPILDYRQKPYVFAHIDENIYTSAFSIFAGGSSFQWVRDQLCKDITAEGGAYTEMTKLAEHVPVGSGGIFFNPSLAGGTSQDKSIHIRGAYVGLHLGTTRDDMIRAAMEGIAMNLKQSLNFLQQHTTLSDYILICGGGSKSKYWMQMFSDIFNTDILKTNIDQDAASIGAAAIAARGLGLWSDYSKIDKLHVVENRNTPNTENVPLYAQLFKTFTHVNSLMADLGDYMNEHRLGE